MIALESTRRLGLNVAERTVGLLALSLAFFALEIYGGSTPLFAGLVALYVLAAALAIRCQGGLNTLYGAIVFYFSCQHVLVSQVLKVFHGENPMDRLNVPVPAILAELLVLLGFAGAGVIGQHVKPNRDRPLFPPLTNPEALQKLALAATILAVSRILLIGIAGGLAAGPFRMLGIVDFLAVSAAVASAMTQSGGRRLTNKFVYSVVGPIVFFALVGGGRSSIVSCVLSIALTGWAFGYRYRLHHYVLAIVGGLLMFFVVSPYSLEVRSKARSGDILTNVNIAMDVFGDVVSNPMKYQQVPREVYAHIRPEFLRSDYFVMPPGNASNVMNRFSVVKPSSMIVEDTIKHGTTGWANFTPSFPRLLPSFLNPDKQNVTGTGNALAHRVKGLVGENDPTTGIVIGLTADSFSAFSYLGTFLLPLGLLLLVTSTNKLLVRMDMRRNVFALAIFGQTFFTLSEEIAGVWLQVAIYNTALLALGLFIAMQCTKLVDMRYLRPKRIPSSWADEDPAPGTPR